MLHKSKVLPFFYNHPYNFQLIRTFIDDIEIKFIRDRGLDHVVEKEKDLKPMINLKNLLKLEPSKSLPLSTIVDHKDTLKIPFRPIEFIRKYPSIFQEYFPANIGVHPHVRLSEESLSLDGEEQLVYGRDEVRKSAADRLLKLLMLCRVNEIPLKLIDLLKWDLGLPDDYVTSLVPEFPDYFQVRKDMIELVCWSDELAVSVLEKAAKKAKKEGKGAEKAKKEDKGVPIAFPMKFSQGFEMDKRMRKWIDEWQKLPYVSPYENAAHLQPNSDESDKWVVAVLHELLHILVPKKTERENVLVLGEYLGVRARFKRALIHHPGIFYLSSKIGTYTVVLREGYKRGMLIDRHPLMDVRSKYIHLMHKEVQKPKIVPEGGVSKKQAVKEVGVVEKENGDSVKQENEEMQVSSSDVDESDDEEDEEEEDDDEEEARGGGRRGRRGSNASIEEEGNGGRRGGRRGSSKFTEEQANSGRRGGRRGSDNTNEEHETGGHKGGRRGFNKFSEEQVNSGRRGGRRGSSYSNGEQASSGRGGGRRGSNQFNGEQGNSGRGGGRRGYSKVNEEGQARDRRGSGGGRSGKVNEGERKPGRTAGRGRTSGMRT